MRITLRNCLIILLGAAFFVSCNKKTEQFTSEPLSNYMPVVKGKYVTYRVDSTVYTNFGHNTEVHKYQVKHTIDSMLTDNLGRPAYRVYRFIRDSAGTQPWTPNGTYFITPLSDRIEVVEDNLRIMKLHLPIKENFRWKGNTYLPNNPYGALFGYNDFSADDFINDWDFVYGGIADETIGTALVRDVLTVNYDIVDASTNVLNNRVVVDTSYAFNTFALEKYAKNIGLVYREYIIWEHQNNPIAPPLYNPYNVGFSLKMWMIDHN